MIIKKENKNKEEDWQNKGHPLAPCSIATTAE